MQPTQTDISQQPSDTVFHGVAVIIPCLNEAASIGGVIEAVHEVLPGAGVYVCDNGSVDDTAQIARAAGAFVLSERERGKGNAVRRLFRDIEAEVYIMVDGDLTYDMGAATDMVHRLRNEGFDLIVGARQTEEGAAYRRGHRFGNAILTGAVAYLFGRKLQDMLSGFRVMSRRFVKTFPIETRRFEIETEMTVHAFQIEAAFDEVPVAYRARGEDSESKLNTWRDGFWILRTICDLLVIERPLTVFGGLGIALILTALFWFLPILTEYRNTGLVARFPTLIVCVTLGLTGLISIFSGIILHGIARTRRAVKRLAFLGQRGPRTT